MSEQASPQGPGRAIARRDFEAIIRRAAELSLAEADAGEQLSEEELLKIGAELGLPAQHVRQALYERPTLETPARWFDRYFGAATLSESRSVASEPAVLQRRLEEYLCSREYLQVVRRRPNELSMIPAGDAISKVARVFARPSSRFGLAHAERVVVGVNPLPGARSHVRIETDFAAERQRSANGALLWGGSLGVLVGGALAGFAIVTSSGAVEAVMAGGSVAASVAAGLTIAVKTEARRFRDMVVRVHNELEHLLDRVEAGQSLEPPPAPWRRNLQARLFGPPRR